MNHRAVNRSEKLFFQDIFLEQSVDKRTADDCATVK